MGQGQSKPPEPIVFDNNQVPIQFTTDFLETIGASKETNFSRSATLEGHIQERVRDELAKIRKREQIELDAIANQIFTENVEKEKNEDGEVLNSTIASGTVDELRRKLDSRGSVIKEMDESVRKARNEVITCLRLNDRRPLDCWYEVEQFKASVGQLQARFIQANQ